MTLTCVLLSLIFSSDCNTDYTSSENSVPYMTSLFTELLIQYLSLCTHTNMPATSVRPSLVTALRYFCDFSETFIIQYSTSLHIISTVTLTCVLLSVTLLRQYLDECNTDSSSSELCHPQLRAVLTEIQSDCKCSSLPIVSLSVLKPFIPIESQRSSLYLPIVKPSLT